MTKGQRHCVRSWLALPATLAVVVLGACGSSTTSAVVTGGHSGSDAGGTGGDGGTSATGTGGSASGGTGVGGTAAPGTGGSTSGSGGTAGRSEPGTGGSASGRGGGTGTAGTAGGGRGGTGTAGGGRGGNGGTASGGTAGAGTATSWVHGTDPFPNSAGDSASLLVTPAGDIYVGRSVGLAKSSDHGASWTTVTGSNWPATNPAALVLNSKGELVVAVGIDATSAGLNVAAFRYSGGTWTKSAGITATRNISQFVLDKTGALMASTAFDGDVWRSTDDGTSFTKVAPHIGGGTVSAGGLWAIAKGPNGDLYTGGEMPTGLYRSTDNGTSWTAVGLATPTYKDNLITIAFNRLGDILVSRNDTLGNGLQRYTGGAWTASASGITAYSTVRAILVNPSSGTVYATAYTSSNVGTLYISTNDGQSWQSFSSGLPAVITPVLAMGPDGVLYTVTRYGEFYRTNGAAP